MNSRVLNECVMPPLRYARKTSALTATIPKTTQVTLRELEKEGSCI